jgi:hypothetical protein
MARSTIFALMLLPAVCVATPASAQFPNIFDTLFGQPPPRPPADVPGAPQSEPQYIPPGGLPPGPPPRTQRYPGGPPRSGVQTQPLPPPPGATSAPAIARGAPPGAAPQDIPPGTPASLPPGQRLQRGTPPPASVAPHPSDVVVVEPPPHKITNPTAVFAGLDKITGRIISFDVAINETVRFGALEVTPRACYTRPPTEAANTDGFIEVDELTLQGELRRIFTGWMFAASPGLSAVEHPIYDIWLTDCKGGKDPTAVAEAPAADSAPPPTPRRPPARTQSQPRRATQQLLPPPPSAPAR